MKTLQKLVPNSNKVRRTIATNLTTEPVYDDHDLYKQTDKASMLDEVIDYLKQLQAQVQVMSRMSSMMMPMGMAMPPLHQMSVMAQMAQMAQGMMNMGSLAQSGYAGLTPPMMHPPPFVPMSWDAAAAAAAATSGGGAVPDAFSAFLACQAQQNGQVRTCKSYLPNLRANDVSADRHECIHANAAATG